ncbi:Proteophosphoglycan ppg1, related [Neospora caninum Liverpool]|uniref:Proteophosphoglycan ppg1, related n=3 Tax=Neospora caninum TaxID=29176 RepID=F0VLF8_NEOCL|nr:Proteophosphoglycan ppg1, related [Neospora caninum Liverpool]CBZ54086.1 Proteophosphoglycan ppg1, related [Neospora caninum Liverpool]CEL68784.1 TPA: Proteophosphoglycan ppg1, related [Neospora caninum Liverpool]|eukprot:XP_003884117.1 Proteophosphoglycan ppg1, related [Neospora caninum Liverpool]
MELSPLLLQGSRTGSGGLLVQQKPAHAFSRSSRSARVVFVLGFLAWVAVVRSGSSEAVALSVRTPDAGAGPNAVPPADRVDGDSEASGLEAEFAQAAGGDDAPHGNISADLSRRYRERSRLQATRETTANGDLPDTPQSDEAMPPSSESGKDASENVPGGDEDEPGEPATKRDLNPETVSPSELPSTDSLVTSTNAQGPDRSPAEGTPENSHQGLTSSGHAAEARETDNTRPAQLGGAENSTEATGPPETVDAPGSPLSTGDTSSMNPNTESEESAHVPLRASSPETPDSVGTHIGGGVSQNSTEMSLTRRSGMHAFPESSVATGSAGGAEQNQGNSTGNGGTAAASSPEGGAFWSESESVNEQVEREPDSQFPSSGPASLDWDAKGEDTRHSGERRIGAEDALEPGEEDLTVTSLETEQPFSSMDEGKGTDEDEPDAPSSPAHVVAEVGNTEASGHQLFATDPGHLQYPVTTDEERTGAAEPVFSLSKSDDAPGQREEPSTNATEEVREAHIPQIQPETQAVAPSSSSDAAQPRAAVDPERSDAPSGEVNETAAETPSHPESGTPADSPLSGPLEDLSGPAERHPAQLAASAGDPELLAPAKESEREVHGHAELDRQAVAVGVDDENDEQSLHHGGATEDTDDRSSLWFAYGDQRRPSPPDGEYWSVNGVSESEPAQEEDTLFMFRPAHQRLDVPQSEGVGSFETHKRDAGWPQGPHASQFPAKESPPPLHTRRPASFSFFGRPSPSSRTKQHETPYYMGHQSDEKASEPAYAPSPIVNAYGRFGGRPLEERNVLVPALADGDENVLVGLQSARGAREPENTARGGDADHGDAEVSSPRRRAEPDADENEETTGSDNSAESQPESGPHLSPSADLSTSTSSSPSLPGASAEEHGVPSVGGAAFAPVSAGDEPEAFTSGDAESQEMAQAGAATEAQASAEGEQAAPSPSAASASSATDQGKLTARAGSVSDPREGRCSREELDALTEYFSGQSDTCSAYRCIEAQGLEFRERLKEHYGSVFSEGQLDELAGLFAACYCRCPMMKCEVDYVMDTGSTSCKEATVEYCEQSNEKFVDRCTSAAEQLPLVYDLHADTGGFKQPCRVCRREDLPQSGVGSVAHPSPSAPSGGHASISSDEQSALHSGSPSDVDGPPFPSDGRETGGETGRSGAALGHASGHPAPSAEDVESGRNEVHGEQQTGAIGAGSPAGWGDLFSPEPPTSHSGSSPPAFNGDEDKEEGDAGAAPEVSTMPSSQAGAGGASEDPSPLLGGDTVAGDTLHGPGEVLSPSGPNQGSPSSITTVRPTTTGNTSSGSTPTEEGGEAGSEAVEVMNQGGAVGPASGILLALVGSLLGIVTLVA